MSFDVTILVSASFEGSASHFFGNIFCILNIRFLFIFFFFDSVYSKDDSESGGEGLYPVNESISIVDDDEDGGGCEFVSDKISNKPPFIGNGASNLID